MSPTSRVRTPTKVHWTFRRSERIKIPQPVERPLHLRTRNLVRYERVRPDPWWFTLHRRGPRRLKVGEDPLEARAIPKNMVRGTLPERILYKALIEHFHFIENADFDFQSSQQGGRMEIGGIVADFLFPVIKIVLQVQGPTHYEYMRMAKDQEQLGSLAELGYTVYEIDEKDIYDEYKLENILRAIFDLSTGSGNAGIVDSLGPLVDGMTQMAKEILEKLRAWEWNYGYGR